MLQSIYMTECVSSHMLSKRLNFAFSHAILNFNKIWIPILTTDRGAKRGYRGRNNATRKKKIVEDDNAKLVKTKTFNVKKKKISYEDIIDVNDNDYIDFMKRKPLDNVFLIEKYPTNVYNLVKAINIHKEVSSPEIYDNYDGMLYVKMWLNMCTAKKTKFVPSFSGILLYKHTFDFPTKYNNRILAFSAKVSEQEKALEAGALIAGGKDLVKKIIKGQVKKTDFDHVISTPDFMAEVAPLRGVLGRSLFPSQAKGSIGEDLPLMVERFSKSVSFSTTFPYIREDVAIIECMLSKIGMPVSDIEDNFKILLESILSFRPASTNIDKFITRLNLSAPPSPEILEIDFKDYLPKSEVEGKEQIDQESLEDAKPSTMSMNN